MKWDVRLLRVVSLAMVLALLSEQVLWGQVRTSLNINDITGRPSSITASSGLRKAQLAQRQYERGKKKQDTVAQGRIDKNKGLVGSKPTINVVQNLTLAFVDVNGRPVAQLPVSLTVRGKSGTKSVDAITGNDGRVTAQRVSPLPAAVEITLKPSTVGPDALPEWALKDPLMASVLVEKGTGTRIAEREIEQPYEVASLAFVAKAPAKRSKTYFYSTTKRVELVRNVVDLVCSGVPAQTEVSWPTSRPGENGTSVSDGASPVVVQLPASSFAFGSVPLTFSRKSDEGVFEAVSNDYPHDPYASENRVASPEMELVALNRDRIPQCADLVLERGTRVEERYSELKRRNKDKSLVEANVDGSQWWKAGKAGLWFRLRTAPGGADGKASDSLVECVRMVSSSGGSIAGIKVGDDESKVRQLLGAGSETSRSIAYLDRGLRFNLAAHKVDSVDIFRPTDLLASGTTAFAARKPASVYVQECDVNGHWSKGPVISGTDALKAYLVRTGVITLADSPDKADYTLSCRISDLVEKQDMPLDMIPLKYECSMTLTYSLKDNVTGNMVFNNEMIKSSSRSDFWEALAPVLVVVGVLMKKSDSDLVKVLVGGLGVAFVQALKDSAKQAAVQCPLLVEQTAYSRLANGLYDTFDCRSRVTKIDYDKGTLTLNVGTADGVKATGANPSSFEILVNSQSGPQPLQFKEEGTSADYYAAEVISADEHTCVCTLKHVKRWLRVKYGLFGKSFVGGMVEASDDVATLRKIPDPATGIVSARMKLRFLPLVPKPTGMAAEQ
ncbi:MAG: hypothetical protein NT018_07450 [Armatimonadetes bacterium]|nr:hypothetical protein [Armatimonadota bacterium]